MDEFEAIARFFRPLATAPGALGLADDAGLITPPAGADLVVTTDTLVAGVHFRADDPADAIGHKLLAVNLSDLAAMGATPIAYQLAVALPAAWSPAMVPVWLAGFTHGLQAMQTAEGIGLLGGDTVVSPGPLVLTLTAIGQVAFGRALTRAGARQGDLVCVSGTIGDGHLGLVALDGRLPDLDAALARALIDRYRRPTPRLALGRRLLGVATAAADVSDGLIADLGNICRASAVTATIAAERVPLSPAARAVLATVGGESAGGGGGARPTLASLLGGGDDYELVFTIAAGERAALAGLAGPTAVTVIGEISGRAPASAGEMAAGVAAGEEYSLVTVVDHGRPLPPLPGGYRHRPGGSPDRP